MVETRADRITRNATRVAIVTVVGLAGVVTTGCERLTVDAAVAVVPAIDQMANGGPAATAKADLRSGRSLNHNETFLVDAAG